VKLNSGKLVIIAILGAAVAAAGFAWWRQYQEGRRALAYWGTEGARLIRTAPEVELQMLGGGSNGADGQSIAARRDVSQARGLVHARQALISDVSFLWNDKAATAPVWEYAFLFRDGERDFTLLLDLSDGWASAIGEQPVRLGPTLSHGLGTFVAEQFAAP
jgi:hypothetical protein